MSSVLKVDLGLSSEYAPMINDIVKQIVIRTVSHLLGLWVVNQLGNAFNINWMQNTAFILIGFMVYHLIVKKILQITYG